MLTFFDLGNHGSLGNQLFQIYSTSGLAKKLGKQAKFPNWKYSEFFKNPPQTTSVYPEKTYYEKDLRYNPSILDDLREFESVNLLGYFQSPLYFDKSFKLEPKNFRNPLGNVKNCVAMHIRRGDFLRFKNIYINLFDDTEYYQLALNQLKGRKVFVFSDDIGYCKKNRERLNIKDKELEFVGPEFNLSDIKELLLISKFPFIITANSTFSWWGAYLSKKSKVYTPYKWFSNEKYNYEKTLIPEELGWTPVNF